MFVVSKTVSESSQSIQHEAEPPTSRLDLPTSLNLIEKVPHRSTQRSIY